MARTPFDVDISDAQRQVFVDNITDALSEAISARTELDADTEYWMDLYEQARTRTASNSPWPDAADLTSYLATEKVDALHSRLMRTVFTEPICTVEGWGRSAERAPIVEEFHQWKAEEERLQSVVDRCFLLSLIDGIGIHEVIEGVETRMVREEVVAQAAIDEVSGLPLMDENGRPVPQRDENGQIIRVDDPEGRPVVEMVLDQRQPIRTGPVHKCIPFRDFYMLPGHARDRSEVWGYAKRFYRRMPELRAKAADGIYDEDAVESLTEASERETTNQDERSGVVVTNEMGEDGHRAEKQLWEILVLWDFDDGDGERWFLATVHLETRTLLRVQYDDLGDGRYITYIPIPRPDSVYGYSLIGHKLLTAVEEHTAWRNMNADKASLAVMAPILRLTGSLWDPDEQPIGPKSVIDVNRADELTPMSFPDIPAGAIQRERDTIQAAERLAGVNDTATGQTSRPNTTLGEVQLVAHQSFVRMDTMIHRVQETIEDLFQIRHSIWLRALQQQAEGAQLPSKALVGLENRGVSIPEGSITVNTLTGAFRFKPRGSVESADLNRKRGDLVQFIQFLAQLANASEYVAQRFANPEFTNALLEEAVRVFGFENRQALLGPATQIGQPAAGAAQMDPAAMIRQLMGAGGSPGLGLVPETDNPVLASE